MSPRLLNILLILIPVVLYYGYLDPMYFGNQGFVWTPESNITSLKSQNVQYANALNQVSLIEKAVSDLNKDYKDVDDTLKNKVIQLLPDSIDDIKLRREVTSIADKTGVAITGLRVTTYVPGKADPNVGYYGVTFTVQAHYLVFKTLMENYEKSTRLFLVNNVSIIHPEKKGEAEADRNYDPDSLTIGVGFSVPYLK